MIALLLTNVLLFFSVKLFSGRLIYVSANNFFIAITGKVFNFSFGGKTNKKGNFFKQLFGFWRPFHRSITKALNVGTDWVAH